MRHAFPVAVGSSFGRGRAEVPYPEHETAVSFIFSACGTVMPDPEMPDSLRPDSRRDDVRAATHVGVCVADLDRSTRFYEGLGFEVIGSLTVDGEFARLMDLEGEVALDVRVLRRDGLTLELLCFREPGHRGTPRRRPMNELGFTHLSLRVEDLDSVASLIEALGGAAHTSTRTRARTPSGSTISEYLYCTDPDGVRIELVCRPGPLDD
jgi:lactoylglutathione lyase